MGPSVVSWHCALLDPGGSAWVKFSLGWGVPQRVLHIAPSVRGCTGGSAGHRNVRMDVQKSLRSGRSLLVLTHTEHNQCVF